MIGVLTWTVEALGTTLTVADAGNINIDDQNVPAITGSVVVPFDQTVFDGLDPRQSPPPRVKITGTMTEWVSQTVAAISDYAERHGAGTIADLSTAWATMNTGQISELFGSPLSTSAQPEPSTMTLDLHVREIREVTGTNELEMRISFASDEALLTDWGASQFSQLDAIRALQEPNSNTYVRNFVNPVMQYVLGYVPAENVYSDNVLTVPYTDIMNWNDYPSAWDMIRPALEDANLKLRVNRNGAGFTLQHPLNPIPGADPFSLLLPEDVISAERIFTRSGDWYDAALLSSVDGPPNYGYPAAPHSRTYRETLRRGVQPSTSMAQNIVTRAENRGALIEISAPIKLGLFMRDNVNYIDHGGAATPDDQWVIKSISYDMGTGLMSITGEHPY